MPEFHRDTGFDKVTEVKAENSASMLSIGGMRSYDKTRGTDTKRVGLKQ